MRETPAAKAVTHKVSVDDPQILTPTASLFFRHCALSVLRVKFFARETGKNF